VRVATPKLWELGLHPITSLSVATERSRGNRGSTETAVLDGCNERIWWNVQIFFCFPIR